MFVLLATILLIFIHHGECDAIQATANLLLDGTSTSVGMLTFMQYDSNSPVTINGTLNSLDSNSAHGFHVHTFPVNPTTPNCTAAGGHFNPYNVGHGPLTADLWHRHVGDLGNITTDANGLANISISDIIIQFFNTTQSIANRTIIVHRMFDNGGGVGDSNATGNSGARVACGLIQVTVPVTTAMTTMGTSTIISTTTSDGLHIKPTMLALFLTIVTAVLLLVN